jgi:DNA (cytosine-5)-methyltransferase 1
MVNGVEVILAMNHWQLAIETHNTNHPDTTHVLADISQVDPRRYPPTDILITSPECTNHSLSKGKQRKNLGQLSLFGDTLIDPAEERSRATMWDVPRFAEYHNYRFVIVENVVDARNWRLFDAWILAMKLLDYELEIVYLNSMFAHPTPQSRDRMYVVFWKKGNQKPDLAIFPKAYCHRCEQDIEAVQSFKPDSAPPYRYLRQYAYNCPHCNTEVRPYYYPAWSAIDWSLEAPRIGDRDRPLKARTLERIEYGLKKYAQPVTIPLSHSHAGPRRAHAVEDVYPTQTTRQTLGLAIPPFLMHYYTRTSAHSPVEQPVPTVTGDPRFALICPPFMTSVNYFSDRPRSVDEPMPTQTTASKLAITVPPYLVELYRTGKSRGVDEPLSTIVAGGNHHGLVVPPFLASYYGTDNTHPVGEPMATVTTVDRHALIEPTESLKVDDCGFRMIQPHEIQVAMAFPGNYVVLGNKREQVKQLGNAVTPPVMKILVERCVDALS